VRKKSDQSPTIYDVANLAGLSIATISRVINSPERVNEATRAKVLTAIEQLGFVPKAEARARALRSTGRIGVLTPFFTAPSFVQRLRGVAASLNETVYELVIYPVDSVERLDAYLSGFSMISSLDGLIIMSLKLDEARASRLLERRLNSVLIENRLPGFNTVEIDDVHGGRMAAEYLLRKGHRRCAFIGDSGLPDYAIHPAINRLIGFRKALDEAGIPLLDAYICQAPYNQVQTRQVANELLNLPDPPTAIFAATDFQALGVLKVARSLGIRVPQDLAVIGFDDLDMSELMDLTTIHQHLDESGRVAVELLTLRLNNPERPVQHVSLPLEIVERETC
jgi:DNA-binding LacI/PurR family transcriptional regulator